MLRRRECWKEEGKGERQNQPNGVIGSYESSLRLRLPLPEVGELYQRGFEYKEVGEKRYEQ